MTPTRRLLLVTALAGCAAPAARQEPEQLDPASAAEAAREASLRNEDRLADRAHDAIDAGDWAEARRLIDAIEVDPLVAEGNSYLGLDHPEEALSLAEQAIKVAPNDTKALLLHGESALQVGRKLGDATLVRTALKSFERIEGLRGYFGASRAAGWLGRTEDQLRLAREGAAAVETLGPHRAWGTGVRGRLPEWPERTLGQALHDRYFALRGEDPEAASALIDEARVPLEFLMERRPREPWAWNMMAGLCASEERFEDALAVALGGLDHVPTDPDLAAAAVTAARGAGGSARVLEVFEGLCASHPEAPLAWWYAGWERFDTAVSELESGPVRELTRAESEFRRCRELAAEHEDACKGYEVMCRNAVGWCRYNAGDLEGARAAFESTEEVLPGGMTYELADRLLPATEGLNFVGDAYRARDDLLAAADVYLSLHRYQPDNAVWANNAGFFHRDAADRLASISAIDCEHAAKGELTDPARLAELLDDAGLRGPVPDDAAERARLFERAAEACRTRSKAMFETSYAAYLEAARLAPDDVRVLNDCALVAVYHLGRDLDRAEEYLQRCVELGGAQLADPDLDEDAREALTEAWGDAHQNLGVLYLEYKNDPETARGWFEKSLEIGPYPRPIVTEEYLPRCTP